MKFLNDYYVISKDFRLVEFNKAVETRYKGIKVGDYCYKATMNRNSPCLHCPIAGNSKNECPIYYDPFYETWVQACFSESVEDKYAVICYPANQVGMDLIDEQENNKVKSNSSGKAANEILEKLIHQHVNIMEGFKGIYDTVFIIDLKKKIYHQLYVKKEVNTKGLSVDGFAEPFLQSMVDNNVAPETKQIMTIFNNLSTVSQRLKGKGIITQEFLSVLSGWCRANIIPIERDDDDNVLKIVYATVRIQEDLSDHLTGCNNRKALSWAYDKANRNDKSIAVVMCDINGLKHMNDTEGHDAGDRYICKVVSICSRYFGNQNVYRTGGDEIVIVVMDVQREEMSARVLEFKKECDIQSVSVSIGYEFREHFRESFTKILEEADRQMYVAKREYYRKKGIDRRSESELNRNSEYLDSLIDYGSSCCIVGRINFKENSYKIIHLMEGYDTGFRKECNTLQDIFYYPVKKGVIHKDDVSDYVRYIEYNFLSAEAAKRANVESWIHYRSNQNRKRYHSIELSYFPGRNFSKENPYGYVFLKDMGFPLEDNRMIFEEVLKDLSENYETIFYLNFDKDIQIPYRMSQNVRKKEIAHLINSGRFYEALDFYIHNYVAESDREFMRQFFTKEYLEEHLRVKRTFSRDYLAIIDGSEVYYRIKISNMDGAGELHHCAVGFENVHSEILSRREFKNDGAGILVVEDSELCREMLKEMFAEEYIFFEAENGEEALQILEKDHDKISLVITDLQMPVCDGLELIKRIQDNPVFKKIPVVVASSYGDDDNKIRCLDFGAADFITKPYNKRIIQNRITSLVKLKGLSQIISSLEKDKLTGLYTKEAFYRYAQSLINTNPSEDYVIAVSDIIGFKGINEQYGKEMADSVLTYLAGTGPNNKGFIIGGRISGDVFACIKKKVQISREEEEAAFAEVCKNAPVPNILVKLGYFNVKDGKGLSVQQMCDRAGMALLSIKNEYGVYTSTYTEEMRLELLTQKQIIDSMEEALVGEQFQVYFQPKFDISTEKICGAEALVRWVHPELGFMPPNRFIPLFERNGFITKLDFYIWKKTCEEISFWHKQGIDFPISVNVSRRDFMNQNLATEILELADSFNIPHELLHLEITESAYADNPEQLSTTIELLHNKGFIIELDDFGTGYSSLTAISNFKIDILKLDMSIIKNDTTFTGRSVLEFSMQLAKMMNLKTIQEGVETKEELMRIKEIGCDYVQGYYFSKPLHKDEFEAFVKNNKKDFVAES